MKQFTLVTFLMF